jgi:hypothetical protein
VFVHIRRPSPRMLAEGQHPPSGEVGVEGAASTGDDLLAVTALTPTAVGLP